jgi:uroporphyrinogen decarboxylase
MRLQFVEGKGPQFADPLESGRDLQRLHSCEASLDYVYEAIARTLDRLAGRVPLIGFAGAPWTLAAYMIEGQGSRTFKKVKVWLYDHPEEVHRLLELLSEEVVAYLRAQIQAGVHAVQLFESWAGALSPEDFRVFCLPYLRRVIAGLRDVDAPLILFARGAGHSLVAQATTGADVLGIDWNTDIGLARERVGLTVALQGNLDPCILYAQPESIRAEVTKVLEKFGPGSGHIFNLGHGILPDVPPEHALAMVQAVRELSPRFHVQELGSGPVSA